jgi:hypothetical protein
MESIGELVETYNNLQNASGVIRDALELKIASKVYRNTTGRG